MFISIAILLTRKIQTYSLGSSCGGVPLAMCRVRPKVSSFFNTSQQAPRTSAYVVPCPQHAGATRAALQRTSCPPFVYAAAGQTTTTL